MDSPATDVAVSVVVSSDAVSKGTVVKVAVGAGTGGMENHVIYIYCK